MMNFKEYLTEALQIGDYVIIKTGKQDPISKAFEGQEGHITSKEDNMYRVRFEKSIYIPNVGEVESDLWEAQYLKKKKN